MHARPQKDRGLGLEEILRWLWQARSWARRRRFAISRMADLRSDGGLRGSSRPDSFCRGRGNFGALRWRRLTAAALLLHASWDAADDEVQRAGISLPAQQHAVREFQEDTR